MDYIVEHVDGEPFAWITFIGKSAEDEKIVVHLYECTDHGGAGSLPALWLKHGYTSERLSNWLNVDVYAIDSDNNQRGRYNPQITANHKINFDWMLPASIENAQKILMEIARRAGISPFGRQHSLKVV